MMKLNVWMAAANRMLDSLRITVVAEHLEIYNIDELGPTTGTEFQIFANNNPDLKINILFDTGAMKSVMSFDTYQKIKIRQIKHHQHTTCSWSIR